MNSLSLNTRSLSHFLTEGSPRQHHFAILALWCLAILVVNPIGDFPLNDDWAYAHNAYALLEGRWYFSDWPAMTLVAHTVWGALFCKIFGASFTVLRLSTLLLGAAGAAAFYELLRWAEVPQRRAFFGTLVLMFNPLWFVSAFSYMTDVPFVALLLWAVLFSLKTVETRRADYLLAAVALMLWACMIRQLGLLLPMVFAPLFLFNRRSLGESGTTSRSLSEGGLTLRNVLYAVLPFALCYACVSGFEGWLRDTGQTPEAYTSFDGLLHSIALNAELAQRVAERSGIILLTLGLFLLPMALLVSEPMRFKKPNRFGFQHVGLLALGLLVLVAVAAGWRSFPLGNVFCNLSLGAVVFQSVPMDDPTLFRLTGFWLFLLKGAAALGAVGMCFLIWKNVAGSSGHARLTCLLALGIIGAYWAFSCINWLLLDRYVLPLVPFVVLLLATLPPTPPPPKAEGETRRSAAAGISSSPLGQGLKSGGFASLVLLAVFSLVGTCDYLTWNRARYAALDQLTAQGIKPEQIDGGFEFNGLHRAGPGGSREGWEKSWWFAGEDEWAVSMHSIYGYDLVKAVPYRRWLPFGTDSIWVNRRKPSFVQDSLWCSMEAMSTDSADYLPEIGNLRPGNARTRSDDRALRGRYSARTHKGQAFGLTTVLDTFRPYDRFVIRVWRYPAKAAPGIVLAADDGDKFWAMETSFSPRPDSAGWRMLEMQATIPEKAVGQKGKVFVWNTSDRDTVWFDDLRVWRWRAVER